VRVHFQSEPFAYGSDGPAEGVLVSVCYAETKLLVPIYQDDDSSDRHLNPVLTDSNGRISFWIQPGLYTLIAQGVSTEVVIGDPESADWQNSVFIIGPPGPPGDEYIHYRTIESSIVTISGGAKYEVAVKSGDYVITTEDRVIVCDSNVPISITLLSAANAGVGAVFTVKNKNTGLVTMHSIEGTVDGLPASSVELLQWEGRTFLSDGTNWLLM
jgi:hypothetical protein